MDFGYRCNAKIAPGRPGYSKPLPIGRAEVYEDGTRWIYEVDAADLQKFHSWARRVFVDNSTNGQLDLEISNNGLTIHVVEV